jgi:hypothetical protein
VAEMIRSLFMVVPSLVWSEGREPA